MKKFALTSICLILALNYLRAQEIVSGTRVSIKPPNGFTKGQNFTGYQKGEEAMINVMDLNGGSFYSNAARLQRRILKLRE